jgi:hypothetical protein
MPVLEPSWAIFIQNKDGSELPAGKEEKGEGGETVPWASSQTTYSFSA